MKNISPYSVLFHSFFVLFFVGFFILPSVSSAATSTAIEIKLVNPIGSKTLTEFMQKILQGVVLILTPVIVIMIIYSGFLFVQAQGNPAEIEKAKGSLKSALIGTALVLGAAGLAKVVAETVKSL